MPRVVNPVKRVTDPVVLVHLAKQGKVADNWEFFQDYAAHGMKEHSPYAKFYRNTDNLSERMMVVSGLPMVDADGVKCEPQWIQAGTTYHQKNNVFAVLVNDIPGRVTLTCKNDQPDGVRKKNDKVVFSPQLFLNGVEIPRPAVSLLPVDPRNPNYLENMLEWDYGICKRHLRTVEGRIHGYWIFPANPGGEVRIAYNQTGQYRLKLGQYAVDTDTEVIPAAVFASASYPFEVSDSATYNPDANPETTSVDGQVKRESAGNWASVHDGAGTIAYPSADNVYGYRIETGISPNWLDIERFICLFDTSGLPDGATISAATLSLYNWAVGNLDELSYDTAANIYASTPASNTNLVAADYQQVGTTEFSTSVTLPNLGPAGTYEDFVLNASGRAAISKTGVSKFGVREASYDAPNNTPSWEGPNKNDLWRIHASEAGAGLKPKLVVTYSTPDLPTVSTQACTGINSDTATANGTIDSIGGAAVTRRGFCYMTGVAGDPTTANSVVYDDGSFGTGAYTKSITGLSPNTGYRVRAYAVNLGGTVYGSTVQLTTTGAPIVTTQVVTSISADTATGNGNITNIGSSSVTEHGHCWNITGTPTTADSKTTKGAGSAGAFTSAITGLAVGIKYYVRAYATNGTGTSYGNQVAFSAGEGIVWPIDTITRVTNIIHRYNRAQQVYTMEVSLGEVTTDFDIPEWTEKSQTSIKSNADKPATKGDVKDDVKNSHIRWFREAQRVVDAERARIQQSTPQIRPMRPSDYPPIPQMRPVIPSDLGAVPTHAPVKGWWKKLLEFIKPK